MILQINSSCSFVSEIKKHSGRSVLPLPRGIQVDSVKELRSILLRNGLGVKIKNICLIGLDDPKRPDLLAWSLAVACAQNEMSTLLIEANLHHLQGHKVNDEIPFGLAQVLVGELPLMSAIQQLDGVDYLDCIPTGFSDKQPLDLFDRCNFANILDALSMHYQVVIITAPAASNVESCMLAASADAALLVLNPGRAKLVEAQNLQNEVEAAGGKWLGAVFAK